MSFQSIVASALLSLHRGDPVKLSEEQVSLLESFLPLPEAKIESPTKATVEELAAMVKKPRTIPAPVEVLPSPKEASPKEAPPKAESPTLEVQEVEPVPLASASTSAVTVAVPAPAPVATNVLELTKTIPEDPLRLHKYRIGNAINMKKCMGRRIDDKHPIPGTSPKFFPEKQCSHGPEKGSSLCKGCGEKDTEAKANPKKAFRGWYGRLDEPMYWNANVIGCEKFNKQYPKGLPEEGIAAATAATATTATATAVVAETAVVEHIAEPTKAKTPEKKTVAPKPAKAPAKAKAPVKSDAEAIPMASLEEPPVPTAVAVETAPVEILWVTIPDKGRTRIYNTKTLNVYECNIKETEREKMVQKDKFIGRYIDGKIDPSEEELEDE